MKIILEEKGFNRQTITDKDIQELGPLTIVEIIIGWMVLNPKYRKDLWNVRLIKTEELDTNND